MHAATQIARRTVAVLSNAYLNSAYAEAEWQEAWRADPTGAEGKLLVFRVENCPRPGLLGQLPPPAVRAPGRQPVRRSCPRRRQRRRAPLAASAARLRPRPIALGGAARAGTSHGRRPAGGPAAETAGRPLAEVNATRDAQSPPSLGPKSNVAPCWRHLRCTADAYDQSEDERSFDLEPAWQAGGDGGFDQTLDSAPNQPHSPDPPRYLRLDIPTGLLCNTTNRSNCRRAGCRRSGGFNVEDSGYTGDSGPYRYQIRRIGDFSTLFSNIGTSRRIREIAGVYGPLGAYGF